MVAVNLTTLSAPSLFCEARSHCLDLTHSSVCSRSCHSHRHRHPLSELVLTAWAPPRPLQPVHVPHLDLDLFLIFFTAEPAPADRRGTHGKRRPRQTLASDAGNRLHVMSREEEGSRAVQSELDGGVPLCRPPDPGRPSDWASLAQPRSPGPTSFFQFNLFWLFVKSLQV
jgi:hypothetical protein